MDGQEEEEEKEMEEREGGEGGWACLKVFISRLHPFYSLYERSPADPSACRAHQGTSGSAGTTCNPPRSRKWMVSGGEKCHDPVRGSSGFLPFPSSSLSPLPHDFPLCQHITPSSVPFLFPFCIACPSIKHGSFYPRAHGARAPRKRRHLR